MQALLMAADQVAYKTQDPTWSGQINARFQKLADQLATSIKTGSFSRDVTETMQCCNELERVARDFYETARTYGRVIINEMHLPVEAKTVRPLKLGGVLGGHKYVVRGVLFKIPNGEMFSAYPDPFHIANKIQGHELKLRRRESMRVFFTDGARKQKKKGSSVLFWVVLQSGQSEHLQLSSGGGD